MNRRLKVAILVIVASPIFAQAQETSTAKMKEEAQKVVKIISSLSRTVRPTSCISKWTNWPLNWDRSISR
jgi:hypothetical protein